MQAPSWMPEQCKNCEDYNEIYMKANGEQYCACDECPINPANQKDESE